MKAKDIKQLRTIAGDTFGESLYIYVDEEYSYRSYLWIYPGNIKSLVDDWVAGKTPMLCEELSHPTTMWYNEHLYKGELKRVELKTVDADRGKPHPRRLKLLVYDTKQVIFGIGSLDDFDGNAHIHENDDSYLNIGYYEVLGLTEPRVTVHILDALADIER